MEKILNLEQQLTNVFGFKSFKKGQTTTITKVLERKSTAAIFPTGSGKSLCYQLPALQLPGLTLVVSPLLSLMKDQLDFLLKHNISAARLDSTLEREHYNQILEKAKNNQLKILMISVERFKNERFRNQLKQMHISLMVIDEAHCISEWGHNFRPDYLKLPDYQKEFNIPQVLLLTATATAQVISDMREKFLIEKCDVVVTGFYRKNLYLQMSPIDESQRCQQLLKRIQSKKEAPTIVYVTLQNTAKKVAEFLVLNHINAKFYHAGMKSEQRETLQNQFMNGDVSCIVATIAFGMGIDKSDVRQVIHYDLPKSIENYSQEIGRSGRDGKPALCEVMANNNNINIHENFVYGDTPEKRSIRQLLENIQNTQESFLELKIIALSKELNIRVLPLKTLLVYLEIEAIIAPKYTYYEEYSFKNIESFSKIINTFNGERRSFIEAVFKNCVKKQKYTYVDIQAIINQYSTQRSRIVAALEYFDEKGMLELQAKQSVERFEIKNSHFDLTEMTHKIDNLFRKKEKVEIKRIHKMMRFFESDSCLSKKLAHYFSEDLAFDKCGHCSHCDYGPANFQSREQHKSLDSFNYYDLTSEFKSVIKSHFSINNLCKFLCGIYAPLFGQYKLKSLNNFAVLESYGYAEVKSWILENEAEIS